MIEIKSETCINCGACADVCPAMVIEEKDGKAAPVNKGACIRCWHCAAVCPTASVECRDFPSERFVSVDEYKPTASKEGVRNLLLRRRSVREFKDKDVPREIIEEMAAIAAHSPTGHNTQAVRLNIVTDKQLIEQIDARILKLFTGIISAVSNPVTNKVLTTVKAKKIAAMLAEEKEALQRFAAAEGDKKMHVSRGAPVLVVAHYGKKALSGKEDCIIALRDMMLLAESEGLGCTWLGYLVIAASVDYTLKKKLNIPLRNKIAGSFIMGWPRRPYKRIIPRKPIHTIWIE